MCIMLQRCCIVTSLNGYMAQGNLYFSFLCIDINLREIDIHVVILQYSISHNMEI